MLAAQARGLGSGYHRSYRIAATDRSLVTAGMQDAPERTILAKAALKVGDLGLAFAIATDLHERQPTEETAEIRDRAGDRLAILAGGWRRSMRAESPEYEPDPTSVLSVLSQSLPIRAGGYATRTHGILTAVAASGWHVEALTRLGFPYDRWKVDDPREVPEFDEVDGIRYHRSLVQGRRHYPQVPLQSFLDESVEHVLAAARRQRAAVIHASSFYATGLPAAEAAYRLGIPFIYEMRGLEDLMKTSSYGPYEHSDDWRFLVDAETEVCRRADHVFVITEALLDEMVRRGVDRDKMSVLPNGVHVADFTPVERDVELAESLGMADKVVIGYLGGFPRYEGLRLLIRAVAELAKERDDFALLMVGDGQQDKQLRSDVEDLGIADRVVFTGRVAHDEIPKYLSIVDITPFPRLPLAVCELISPMKPYESMAMEKAVVVSDVAALTQIVTPEVTGLAFRKGDANSLADTLARLIDDPQLRAELGAQARRWIEANSDWSTIALHVDDVYRRILGQTG